MATVKKIMIIDDDEGILDAISMMLQYKGYEVSTSTDGNIIFTMENSLPGLLLLDIWMSGIDGRNICRQLKQKESTKHMPVIMLSASKDIERSAIEAGADGFLAKPFEMNDLLEKIELYTATV